MEEPCHVFTQSLSWIPNTEHGASWSLPLPSIEQLPVEARGPWGWAWCPPILVCLAPTERAHAAKRCCCAPGQLFLTIKLCSILSGCVGILPEAKWPQKAVKPITEALALQQSQYRAALEKSTCCSVRSGGAQLNQCSELSQNLGAQMRENGGREPSGLCSPLPWGSG